MENSLKLSAKESNVVRQELTTYEHLEDGRVLKIVITRIFFSDGSYSDTHTRIII